MSMSYKRHPDVIGGVENNYQQLCQEIAIKQLRQFLVFFCVIAAMQKRKTVSKQSMCIAVLRLR